MIINKLKEMVEEKFRSESADHDWYHIERVLKLSEFIQEKEGGDLLVVQAAALLHDISDYKLNGGIKNDCERVSREILTSLSADSEFIDQVCSIVDRISFKGAGVEDETGSLELAIVQTQIVWMQSGRSELHGRFILVGSATDLCMNRI